MLISIARPHGNSHGPQALTPQLKTNARRPEAVARCNLHAIGRCYARNLITPCKHLRPILHILGSIGNDNRRASSARRAMDTHHFFVGNGLNAKRICFTQIGFFGKGKFFEIGLRTHIRQINIGKLTGIECRVVFEIGELVRQKVKLFIGNLHSYSSSFES